MIRKIYFVLSLVLLTSCGEYQKVLNRGSIEEQYKMAVKMYEAKKYSKALRLFEKVTPAYRTKPQMERIQYMVANSNFNEKNYSIAGYYFNRFSQNYPKSSKQEEADFLSALSYYKAAPVYSKDPTDTNKALESFQSFIDKYPDSPRLAEANKYYNELQFKLETKAFEIAKGYYITAQTDSRNYRAAITAFDNLITDYLGTRYKEEALYLRFKAAHDFAMKSIDRKKEERINNALKAYEKLKRNFPESKFKKESEEMLDVLNKEQERIQQLIVNSKS
ncbi:Beta-barrel assembly machine subunit BamD [Tenacibaculum skagerrakense]|uniref:Beta-barrel assembly machine subunit BamD n=1 Tax=Tenacibaculum skagerrakense TaxID=186571 RepID=A0A4R2NUD7_9FLAO|nr:outer membrane protein assembly factor BamD [Tenacibaculum skagerrakense]TCP25663.1 Beta-barrel assembly machine subunit BamD [Tenacibaculum skagerrakense]